jgi:hypothetical protein
LITLPSQEGCGAGQREEAALARCAGAEVAEDRGEAQTVRIPAPESGASPVEAIVHVAIVLASRPPRA